MAAASSSPPLKKSKTDDNKKYLWLITYTVCSPDITPEILHSHGIKCDQCYSISWRESKYTLIHLGKDDAVRCHTLKKALINLQANDGIQSSSLVGFDTLESNGKADHPIEDHPGFKRMIETINHKPDEIRMWLQQGTVQTNRKCILRKYMESIPPKEMTHAQLVSKVLKWTPIIQSTATLQTEIDVLRTTLSIREKEINDVKEHNSKLFNDLLKKMDECTKLKQRLIQHGLDHTVPP